MPDLRGLMAGLSIGQDFGDPLARGLARRYDIVERQRLRDELFAREDRLRKEDLATRNQDAANRLLMAGASTTIPGPYQDAQTLRVGDQNLFFSQAAQDQRAHELAKRNALTAGEIANQFQAQDESRKLLNENLGFTVPVAGLDRTQGPTQSGQPLSGLPEGFAQIPGTDQALNVKAKEDALIRMTQAKRAQIGIVDPDTLRGAVEYYRNTGNMPAFGMGNTPLRTEFFKALGSDGSNAIAEGQENKVTRAGMSKAYATQQNFYQAEKTALGALDRQLKLASEYSSKVDRTGSPVINKYLLYLKGDVAGDEDTKALENLVTTASYEFAKIMSGSSASIQGVTISSAEDSKKLLNASMTNGQFQKVLELMKQEGEFRLNARQQTINELRQDIGRIGADAEAGGQSTDVPKTAEEFLKKKGLL